MKLLLSLLAPFSLFLDVSAKEHYYKNEKKVTLKPIPSLLRSENGVDFYEDEKGFKMGVSNRLLVQFKECFKESSDLQKYLLEFNAVVEKRLGGNLYLLKLSNKNATIDVANALHQKEDVVFAHPDFLKRRLLR